MSGGWRRHGLSVYRTTIGGGDVLEVAQADGSKDKERLLALAEAVHAALTGPSPAAAAAMADALRQCIGTLDGIAGADWRKWEDYATAEGFAEWAKSRARWQADLARAALAEQPQEPGQSVAGRWIAVTDQLPAFDEGDVIVYTADHDFGGEQFHQIEAADFYYRDEDRPDDETGTEVARVATHWMPASWARPGQPQPQEPAREPSDEEIEDVLTRFGDLLGHRWGHGRVEFLTRDVATMIAAMRAVRAWKPEESGRG